MKKRTALQIAVDKIKCERKIYLNQIIDECACSRAHFNKVLCGERIPSAPLKKRLAKVLNITEIELELLLEIQNKRSNARINTPFAVAVLSKISMCILIFFPISIDQQTGLLSNQGELLSNQRAPISPLVFGDRSLFIKDVTIPDGTPIKIHSKFKKIWQIKNVGTVVWKNRYLARTTTTSKLLCQSMNRVPIPETLPNHTVNIEVDFVAPAMPGSCRTDWKMATARGELFFPNLHGLFSIVTIIDG